jgi:hypothetical protein
LQRGYLPRGVILSSADLDLIKAFDRNKDGILEPEELELAQMAFKVFDPDADAAQAAEAAGGAASSSSFSSSDFPGRAPSGLGMGSAAAAPVPSGYGGAGGGSNYGSRRPSGQVGGGGGVAGALSMQGNSVLPGTGAAYLGRR